MRLWIFVTTLFRGCRHPQNEPVGVYHTVVDGERVNIFAEWCPICGITIISTD